MGDRAEASGQSDMRNRLDSILTLSEGILIFNTCVESLTHGMSLRQRCLEVMMLMAYLVS